LITGAGSGIGRATAVAMAKLGGRMFLTDINAAGLAETRASSRAGSEVCASRASTSPVSKSAGASRTRSRASSGPWTW
jgi:NADP-dependent 3-hydroxy acid dehydrogenase YdfG